VEEVAQVDTVMDETGTDKHTKATRTRMETGDMLREREREKREKKKLVCVEEDDHHYIIEHSSIIWQLIVGRELETKKERTIKR